MGKKELTDSERTARVRQIQAEESERKRNAAKQSPETLRKVLDDGKQQLVVLNQSAMNQLIVSARWTDERGTPRSATGQSISYPSATEAPDLFVRSNRRSIQAIHRHIKRVDHALDLLIDACRADPKALPENLDQYVAKLISEIPGPDTIKLEIIIAPTAVSAKA